MKNRIGKYLFSNLYLKVTFAINNYHVVLLAWISLLSLSLSLSLDIYLFRPSITEGLLHYILRL